MLSANGANILQLLGLFSQDVRPVPPPLRHDGNLKETTPLPSVRTKCRHDLTLAGPSFVFHVFGCPGGFHRKLPRPWRFIRADHMTVSWAPVHPKVKAWEDVHKVPAWQL